MISYQFEIIVERYEKKFTRKISSVLRNQEDIQDVVQDSFVKIFLKAKQFSKREGASFSSWAYKILLNTSYTVYQKQKKTNTSTVSLDDKLLAVLGDTHKSNFTSILDRDEVLSYISKLPDIFQHVSKKFYVTGKTHKEISKEECISENVVRTRLHRARKEIKKIMQKSTLNN